MVQFNVTGMKRIYFLLFLLFSATHFCLAQLTENRVVEAEIDSLLHEARENNTNFDQALADVLTAKAKALATFGDQAPRYAACLCQQAHILSRQGKYAEALQGYQDAIAIQARTLGGEHPDYVRCVVALGELYLKQGDMENAGTRLQEARSVSRRTNRTEDDGYAALMTSLGNYYRITGDLDEAGECYQECVRIRENIFGKTHRKYAGALHNAALVNLQRGDYETAERQFREAQSVFAETLGTNSENYGTCIQNLSALYMKTGDFDKAEKLALEALEVTANILGENHVDYAINLENIGNLYLDMGNYEKARTYYLRCKNLRETLLGKEHYYYGISLNNLGNYFMAVRDAGQAEQHFAMALDVYQKSLGSEHYYTTLAKDNLAWSYREQGKYQAAESLILEVIRVREKYQGNEHPDLARSLVNLAFLQKQLHKYEEAEKLYRQANQIWAKTAGPESLNYLATLREIASLQAITGQTEEALQSLAEAGQLQKMAYFRASGHLTEKELAAYIARFSSYFHQHFSFLQNLQPAPGTATAQAFDDAIFQKGYLLDQASRVKQFTVQDPAFAAQYRLLGQLQTALAAELAKPPAERSNMAEMEEQINAIEKTLVTAVAGYRERFAEITWRDIRQTLQPGEAAVEFVHFAAPPENPGPDNIRYAALVLPAGDTYPSFVPLCSEKELAGLMKTQGSERREAINQLYFFDEKQPGRSLFQLLWQPLEAALGTARTVYFSPTGLLHRLNLEAIRDGKGQVLADRFQLIKMGSTRQLVMPGRAVATNGSAELFGGIEYDPEGSLSANPEGGDPAISQELAGRNETGPDSTTLHLRGEKWEYLDWTRTEIETIGLLTEGAGLPTYYRTGPEGSEEACKKLGSGQISPRILHLATHGYFFPGPKENAESGTGYQTSEHPMIRSGLILAGGNFAWKNGQPIRPGADDGILTAYEIAQMDLSQTELVVLSACETGLGDIQGTEGVYGLQRAFKFAGVKYVLSSLWQVPDFQTQELMAAFYYNWLEEQMDIPAAFRAAQAELRKQYPEPFLWAAFVLLW